jgi:hypothetical protein
LRHHAEGIFLAETVFGPVLENSAGRKIPTRFLGEQHVKEDLGWIPTAQDWLACLRPLQQVRLSGTGAAAGAAGRAYWSRALGLVFNASQLPALGADRSYELWVIPAGGAPISVGLLAVGTNGSASHTAALPDGLAVTTVAVTIEAAGGSPTGGPTTTPVLAGVQASCNHRVAPPPDAQNRT